MGANYSFEKKNIEIWAPAFFKHNSSFIATVKNFDVKIRDTYWFFVWAERDNNKFWSTRIEKLYTVTTSASITALLPLPFTQLSAVPIETAERPWTSKETYFSGFSLVDLNFFWPCCDRLSSVKQCFLHILPKNVFQNGNNFWYEFVGDSDIAMGLW